MASCRWEARAQQRKETHAAALPVTRRSTVQIIRPAPSSNDDRSIGETELTIFAKITSCSAHAFRCVRGGFVASLMLFLLAGYRDHAYAQTTAASQKDAASQTATAGQTTAASQTTSQKKVDFGVGAVSGSSFKFGEYNGLQNSGPFGIGNFDFRGGAPYDSKSTWRWQMKGTNLGLETRSLYAEFGKQGKYRFFVGYSELLANRSDTYQTPYLGGSPGNFTLPSNWLFPAVPQAGATKLNFRGFDPVAGAGSIYNSSGVLTAPTAAQLTALASIIAADVPSFHNLYLSTKRTRVDAGLLYNVSKKPDIPVSYTYEHKSGLKALGTVTSQVSENSVILPTPIDFDTSQANAAVNYRFKQVSLSVA